jgi:hypothetical protein
MSIPVAAGKVGQEILKHLYTGKKWVGTQSVKAADFAGKKGYPKVSKAITGTAQRGNQAIKYGVSQAKKYPRTASAIGGAVAWDMLDNE